jgi:DNA (cytosine-5)-methyltransferase 1
LDLFSGIGGFSLGLESAGFKTVAFCENSDFPRKVLAKHWPGVPIYGDVKELTGERLKTDGITADVICGGYPCQPFSAAGKRKGKDDDRHLWPEVARLIRELQPAYGIFENVAGHISMGLDEVLSDLEGLGYTAEAFVIPACAVNAPHRRDRVWIIAYSDDTGNPTSRSEIDQDRKAQEQGRKNKSQLESSRHSSGAVARAVCESRVRQTKPTICRGDDGVSRKLDAHRLKALGNAVVVQIPAIIGQAIMERENQ